MPLSSLNFTENRKTRAIKKKNSDSLNIHCCMPWIFFNVVAWCVKFCTIHVLELIPSTVNCIWWLIIGINFNFINLTMQKILALVSVVSLIYWIQSLYKNPHRSSHLIFSMRKSPLMHKSCRLLLSNPSISSTLCPREKVKMNRLINQKLTKSANLNPKNYIKTPFTFFCDGKKLFLWCQKNK